MEFWRVFALLITAVALVSAESCDPFMACIEIYQPVCGSDGVTYSNTCELKRASCLDSSIVMKSKGECGRPIINPNCPSVCMALYAPVCGTDGKTYGNRCEMNVESCNSGKKIDVKHPGRCDSSFEIEAMSKRAVISSKCPSVCAAVYAPVCGSDGKSYSNRCQMNVKSCRSGKKIDVKHPGRCMDPFEIDAMSRRAVIPSNCPSICPAVYSPVCGSDGKSYSNSCKLRVASCRNGKSIKVKSIGACGMSKPSRISDLGIVAVSKRAILNEKCNTACFALYDPVCGSDGRTYSNKCRLNVASCRSGKSIKVKNQGACRSSKLPSIFNSDRLVLSKRAVLNTDCNTGCFAVYAPVCGSDGKTYSNQCRLNVASCRSGKSIKVRSRGACRSSKLPSIFDSDRLVLSKRAVLNRNCNTMCLTLHDPVCGSDGKTYSSSCIMRNAACRSGRHLTVKSKGKCARDATLDRLVMS